MNNIDEDKKESGQFNQFDEMVLAEEIDLDEEEWAAIERAWELIRRQQEAQE